MTQIRFAWERALGASDLKPTTRHVLLTLATFFNSQGTCFPSQETIARHSGLTVRAVRKHLQEAIGSGWLSASQSSRRTSKLYSATIPGDAHTSSNCPESESLARKHIPGGRELDVRSDRHNVPTNTSTNTTRKSKWTYATDAGFEALWAAFPRAAWASKLEVFQEWSRLSVEQRDDCVRAAVHLGAAHHTSTVALPPGAQVAGTPDLLTWLRRRSWRG